MNKKLIIVTLFYSFIYTSKVDINNVDYNELVRIPIDKEKVFLIYNFLNAYGQIESIYDLLYIRDLNESDIDILKKNIIIKKSDKLKPHLKPYNHIGKKPNEYLSFEKYQSLLMKNNYDYNGKRLLSYDSTPHESGSEYHVDYYYNPHNINYASFNELVSFKNVSPMDVVAVLMQKDRGEIKGSFQLKNSPGISYYGYKNLLRYVDYNDNTNAYTFRLGFLSTDYKIQANLEDAAESAENVINTDNSIPYTITKASLIKNVSNSSFIKLALLRQNNLGDPSHVYNDKYSIMLKKVYKDNSIIKLNKIIFGNYTAAFAQGVVFDSRDSYNRNRTGYKFDKRKIGIYSDMTTGHQFTLKGLSLEGSLSEYFNFTFFYSKDKRDAIINQDGSFSSLIILDNRFGYGYTGNTSKIYENMIESLNEVTYGGNITFSSNYNRTRFGINLYESLYDRELDPQFLETIIGGDDPEYQGDDRYLTYYSNSADAEIESLHHSSSSPSDSWLLSWDKTASRRQITGLEFTQIFGKMCFQLEYGELNNSDKYMKLFDGDPKAYVASSFIKFDTFDFIMLYRDYDIDFDNPYQRSFSEYQFGKTTILEDSYWLEDPIYENLYSNNPKPQAERGIYIESRYQFHKTLIGSVEYDVWTRKADEARYFNIVTKLDWNPLFNYRVNFRYKWKGRGIDNIHHPSPFYSREARIRFNLRLSNFNNMELLYAWSSVSFNPKPRLVYNSNPLIYEMSTGDVGGPDHSLGVSFSHNFDESLNVKLGVLYAGGFMWYIEDDTFVLLEDQSRTWVSFNYAPENSMSLKFLLSYAVKNPTTTVYSGQTDLGNNIDNPFSFNEKLSYKIQIDYVL